MNHCLTEGEVELMRRGVDPVYPDDPMDDPEVRAEIKRQAAHLFARALSLFVQQAEGSPMALAVLIGRAGGLSYEEISSLYLVSRQDCHKVVKRLRERSPSFARLLEARHAFIAAIAGVSREDLERQEAVSNALKGARKWTNRK